MRISDWSSDVCSSDLLDFHFGQEADGVFRTAVDLRLSFLPAAALDFGGGETLDAHRGEGFAHLVELERLDASYDELHGFLPSDRAARDWPAAAHSRSEKRSVGKEGVRTCSSRGA